MMMGPELLCEIAKYSYNTKSGLSFAVLFLCVYSYHFIQKCKCMQHDFTILQMVVYISWLLGIFSKPLLSSTLFEYSVSWNKLLTT